MKLVLAVAFFLVFLAASTAEAQLCAGATPFTQNPYQLGVGAAFRDGAQGVGGHFAAGGSSLFGGVDLSVVNFSDVDSTQTNIGVFAGSELNVEQDTRVFICPLAAITFGVGPDIGPVSISSITLRGGGQVGIVASDSNDMMIVPTFGLAAAWQRVSAEVGDVDSDASDTFGVANLGVGFIFDRRIGITPGISIPFSVGDSDVAFTIGFTFAFGS